MVAGMLMPLDNLKAIYERLFRDGVMVAKKDKRPQTKHPEIPGVGNLQVIRAMGSLKSRGFVSETFAWQHFYWYLTNEGIVYLRDYLHLPPEIVPTPLQRVRRPAATLSIVQRAAHVQTIEGPTSYVPKPGKARAESQEALLERQGYRHKRMQTEDEVIPREKPSRFRGRPITDDYSKSRASGESRDQSIFSGAQSIDHSVKMNTQISHQLPAKSSSVTTLVQRMPKTDKGTIEMPLIKTTPKTMDLPDELAVTAETVDIYHASIITSKAAKPKEVGMKATVELLNTKTAKDNAMLPNAKEQMEQAMKVTKTKNTQEHLAKKQMPENTNTCMSTSSTSQPVELKPVSKAIHEITITKPLKDTHEFLSDEGQVGKLQRVPGIKNIQEHPVKKDIIKNTETCQELITSKSPKDVSLSSLTKMEKTLKLSKTQNVKENPAEEKIAKKTETPISKSSISTVLKPVEIKANSKTSQELPSNPAEVMLSLTTAVTPSKKQESETKIKQEHLFKDEIPKNANIGISTTTTSTIELKAKSEASQPITVSETAKDISVTPSKKQASKTKIKVEHLIRDEIPKIGDVGISTTSTVKLKAKSESSQPIIVGETAKNTPLTLSKNQASESNIKQELIINDEISKQADIDISTTTSAVELKAKSEASHPIVVSETTKVTSVTTSKKQASKTKIKQEQIVKDETPKNADIGISTTSTTVELKAKSEASQPIIVSETAMDNSVTPSKKQASKTKIKQEQIIKDEITENAEMGISTTTSTTVELKAKLEAFQPVISETNKDTSVTPTKKQASKTKIKQEHLIKDEIPKNSDKGFSTTSATVEQKAKSEASQPIIVSETAKNTSVTPKNQASEAKNKQELIIKDGLTENTDMDISTTSDLKLKGKSEASQPIIVSETGKDTSVASKKQASKTKIKQELIIKDELSKNADIVISENTSVTPSKKQASKTKNKQEHLIKDEMRKNSDIGISTTTSTTVELKANSEASQPIIVSGTAKVTPETLTSKKEVEKTATVTKTKNVEKNLAKDEMDKKTETLFSTTSISSFQPLELTSKVNQELVASDAPKDASIPPQSKNQEEKTLKVTKSKSSQEHLVKEKMPANKETVISILASNVQQTSEASLKEPTGNVEVASALPPAAPIESNIKKSKKSQKTFSVDDTKETQMVSKDIESIQVNALKEEKNISQKSSTNVNMTDSIILKHDTKLVPEISDAAANEHPKEVTVGEEIKVVQKAISKHEITTVHQMSPSIELLEESEAKDGQRNEPAAALKSSKRKKKKQSPADKQVSLSATEISSTKDILTAQIAVKTYPNQGSEPFAFGESPKISSEESSQTAAVQSEAPIHKGKVEPAQPSAEKIKREVLKEKTSSSQQLREAPTAEASAAASAQTGPYPKHGEPPSVTQHLAAPDTQSRGVKQKVLSVSKTVKKTVTAGPLSAEKQVLSEDEAAMRKKIVVVEEVIEVQQQIASPSAQGSQHAVPATEIPEDVLDYDVLEDLAKECAVFQSPVKEVSWDHSLDEPEPKTFPNFIEGLCPPPYSLIQPLPPNGKATREQADISKQQAQAVKIKKGRKKAADTEQTGASSLPHIPPVLLSSPSTQPAP
ncbi:Plectin [Bagarius yarrelli]|uniref:Plectin n=1 Tax=Bagarius yarrelli TaxID=175774 RepID=A0A556V8N8_BAGYA|nr:Plectin [Bagarius yarrelli]